MQLIFYFFHLLKYANNKHDRILSAMDIWIGKIVESAEKSLKNNGKNIKL